MQASRSGQAGLPLKDYTAGILLNPVLHRVHANQLITSLCSGFHECRRVEQNDLISLTYSLGTFACRICCSKASLDNRSLAEFQKELKLKTTQRNSRVGKPRFVTFPASCNFTVCNAGFPLLSHKQRDDLQKCLNCESGSIAGTASACGILLGK